MAVSSVLIAGMFQPVPVSTVLGTKVQVRLDLTYLVISSDGGRKWTIVSADSHMICM